MKKIIRGILIGLLAVIVIGGVSVWFFLFHSKKPEINTQAYVTDPQGSSYLAVVNEEGTTYAAVTDAQGNIYAAEIKDNGEIGEKVGQINDQVDLTDLPTDYKGEHIAESADVNAFTGNAEVVPGADTQPVQPANSDVTDVAQPSSENTAPGGSQTTSQSSGNPSVQQNTRTTQQSGQQNGQTATQPVQTQPTSAIPGYQGQAEVTTTAAPKTYRITKYQQMFNTGTYLMEFKTSDPELGDSPITAAAKNGNFVIDTQIQNYKCKMLYLAKDKTTYLIIDDFKKYTKLPEDMMGDDFDMSSMMSSFGKTVDTSKVETSTVKIGNQTLNCETIKDENGEMRYYFDGDTLVRMDSVGNDGTVDSTYISKLTSDVPDSAFQIPSNYGYLNLSWLEALAG